MAQFNPTVNPTNDPNWLGWSKSISQPEADKSTGIALSEVGNVLDQTIKTADFFVKSDIQDKVIAVVDQERNAYTEALVATNAAVKQNAQVAQAGGVATQGDTPLNLLSIPPDQPIPSQLGNLSSTLSTLDGAKANGKLSETAYYGRLDALAKDLRARYPGYREYIDNQFKNVSGVDAANKFIGGMISDINSFTTNINSELNKDLSFIRQHFGDVPDAPAIYAARQAGIIDSNGVNAMMYPRIAQIAQFKFNQAQLGDIEGNRKLQTMKAEDVVSDDASKSAAQSLQKITFTTSEGQKNIADIILQHQSGKIVMDVNGNPITDVHWEQMSQGVLAERNAFIQNLRTRYNQPGPNGGRSVAAMLGPEKLEAKLKEAAAGHDLFANAIINKETGTAFGTARLLEAQGKGALAAYYKQPGVGPVLLALKALNDSGGPNAVNSSFGKVLTNGNFTPDDVSKLLGLTPKLIGQPDMRTNPFTTPQNPVKIYTFGQAIEDSKVGGGITNAANKHISDMPSAILADPKMGDEGKKNVVRAAMSPANEGYISKFQLDGKAPGKFAIYSDMLSTKSVKEVWRLSGGDANSQLWKDTKQWATSTFASELFPAEIRQLNEIKTMPGVKLTWNNEAMRWDVNIPKVKEFGPFDTKPTAPTPDMARFVIASVNRLNTGIGALANIHRQEGTDANAALMNLFKGLGVNPGDGSIPGAMMNSVISSHAKPDTKGLLQDKALPFSQEPPTRDGSLGAFLSAPIPSGRVVPDLKNNASAGSTERRSVPLKSRGNLTNEDLLSITVDDIPEGMSAREFIQQLKNK